jgi:hypothetical protein
MTQEPFYSPNRKPAPARASKPGELLFEFVRASDRRMFCEPRNPGEDVWGIDEIVGLLGV